MFLFHLDIICHVLLRYNFQMAGINRLIELISIICQIHFFFGKSHKFLAHLIFQGGVFHAFRDLSVQLKNMVRKVLVELKLSI